MAKKADRNQALFTAGARACGLLVQSIHETGGGVPDLIVSGDHQGMWMTLLVELKCCDWQLTADEQKWHVQWRYAPTIITNRLRWVLAWYGWTSDEIKDALAELPNDPGVRSALQKIRKAGDGTVPPEIMATIL